MKAFVNQDICIFCGICGGVCPDVFVIDSDKRKSIALDIELTRELLAMARYAESICPAEAITIKDVSTKEK
ncbi:MAG: ferredoxin [Bacillota bacterium]|nr:ferredoxin [Bacillota bacterium]